MSDLLSSDFARLLKSQIFRAALIFCIEFPICEVLLRYFDNIHFNGYMDTFLNMSFMFFGIIMSVFIGLFVGSEFSDGTMRNKLVAGHTRTAIYISNYIICVTAGFIMQAAYLTVLCSITSVVTIINRMIAPIPALAMLAITTPPVLIIKTQLIGFYIIAAYSAVFLFISMLIYSKSASTVISMSIAIILFIGGMRIHEAASAYSFFKEADYSYDKIVETVEQEQEKQSPSEQMASVSGFKLKAYLFLDDFLPSSQAQYLTRNSPPSYASTFLIYDCEIVAVSTILGVIFFNRKDLK